MNGLMNSPGHRANILTEKLTHLGVGVTRGPGRRVMTWQTMATQLFAEVAAYTADPVPESLQWGSMANFSIAADSSRIGRPEMFDLWSKEETDGFSDPNPPGEPRCVRQSAPTSFDSISGGIDPALCDPLRTASRHRAVETVRSWVFQSVTAAAGPFSASIAVASSV